MQLLALAALFLALVSCGSTIETASTVERPAPRERADAGPDAADAEPEPDAPVDAGPVAHLWCCPPISPPVLGCSAPVTCPAALGQPYCHEAPDGGPAEGPAPGDDCEPGP